MFKKPAIISFMAIALGSCGGSGGSGTPPPVITPPPVNQAPTAQPVASKMALATGDLVSFSGSGSTDPEGESLTYSWEITNQPQESSLPTSYDTVDFDIIFDVAGSYTFALTVSDGTNSTTAQLGPLTVAPFYRQDIEQTGTGWITKNFQNDKITVGTRDVVSSISAETDSSPVAFSLPARADGLPNNVDGIAIDANSYIGAVHWYEDQGMIGFYNLDTGEAISTHAFSAAQSPPPRPSMAFDDQGNFYTFLPTGVSDYSPYVIDPVTGEGELKGDITINAAQDIYIHPDQSRFYTRDRSSSDTLVTEYLFNDGEPVEQGSQTYPAGDLCDSLWIGSDGNRIFDHCGSYITLSNTNDNLALVKNQYNFGDRLVGFDANRDRNLIAVINEFRDFDAEITLLEYDTGASLETLTLNDEATSGGAYWTPRDVYISPNSETIRIVATNYPDVDQRTSVLTLFQQAED